MALNRDPLLEFRTLDPDPATQINADSRGYETGSSILDPGTGFCILLYFVRIRIQQPKFMWIRADAELGPVHP
jgi:hypothetical protein